MTKLTTIYLLGLFVIFANSPLFILFAIVAFGVMIEELQMLEKEK